LFFVKAPAIPGAIIFRRAKVSEDIRTNQEMEDYF